MLRNFVFTLNNYSDAEINHIDRFNCGYVIYGREVGEEGTPHLQGYCELTSQCRLSTLKKRFSERAHIERRLGSQIQAIDYCKKDGNFVERGVPRQQGNRIDLDRTRRLAEDEGMRAVTEHCNFQQIKVAEKYLTYNEEPRDFKPYVYWLYGPTGCGKSRLARELVSDDCFTKNDGTKWWDGYDAHECCIIDDFRDSWWSLTEMLSLLDRYQKKIEFKGGWREFKSRLIIVTSCNPPWLQYRGVNEDIGQLLRRLDCVSYVSEVGG